eukprot:scaffold1115_cov390-Prasinococcus_capsulatus_cf.AAC.10
MNGGLRREPLTFVETLSHRTACNLRAQTFVAIRKLPAPQVPPGAAAKTPLERVSAGSQAVRGEV